MGKMTNNLKELISEIVESEDSLNHYGYHLFKRCPMCGEVKALSEYSGKSKSSGGRQSYCKPCSREYHKLYSRAPRDKKSGGDNRPSVSEREEDTVSQKVRMMTGE